MKNINIDNERITINTTGIDKENFAVPEALTKAQTEFEYVEPVVFGNGCFGNPAAFERFQAIMQQREEAQEVPVEPIANDVHFAIAPEILPC